jgi:DNA-binding NtrC family response regulator
MSAADEKLLELAEARGKASDALAEAELALWQELAERVRAGQRVNVSAVARLGGMSRQTVYNRLESLGLAPADLDA